MAEHESYGIVLQRILRDPLLSVEAKSIYAYLCTFAGSDGTCYPSVSIMCKELGMSETRFYRHMKQLTEQRVVLVEKSRRGSRFAQNVYSVSRPSVSPSRRNEGMENHTPVLPTHRNSGTENEGANSTRLTSTRLLTKTNNIYERLVDLLNEAKSKGFSKGRLKISQRSKWVVDGLLNDGFSEMELIQRAQELAKRGSKNLDWYDFEDYCNQNHRR